MPAYPRKHYRVGRRNADDPVCVSYSFCVRRKSILLCFKCSSSSIRAVDNIDLSLEIKAFAKDHEREIKASVMQMMSEYFDSSISENYEEKWDAGVIEHGPMTEEVLNKINWIEQMMMEFKDSYWYQALILYRKSREQVSE